MRRLLVAVALVAAVLPGAPARAAVTAEVSGWSAQTVRGIGASGAWWPKQLAQFSAAKRQSLADALFTDAGIRMSAYRYNIGGGGTGVTRQDRAPQTLRTGAGTYDWSRDPGGTYFLTRAAQAGVPTLVGFVNSAPDAMTDNARNCGGALKAGSDQAYADYLADVVAHFRGQGVPISNLSPMNEPDNSFDGCTQEGMVVPVSRRAGVVNTLAATLAARGLPVGISGDESSTSGQVLGQWGSWLSTPGTPANVTALAHHTYDWPNDSVRTDEQSLAREYGRPSWASEICCFTSQTGGYGQQYDPTIAGALPMADLIHRSLTVNSDEQFHWWTALSGELGCAPAADPGCATTANGNGWNDGLVYYDPGFAANGNQSLYYTKRFYVLGQYSRFVRPGSVRFPVTGAPTGVQVLATSNAGSWTLVVTNPGAAQSFDVHFNALNTLGASAAYRTSATQNIQPVALPAVNGATASLSVPAQSVTTYVFGQKGGPAPRSGASAFVGGQSGKCLDDSGQSSADDNPIDLWTCTGGANQQWTYTNASELRVYGKCLDAKGQGRGDGTPIVLYTCNGGPNQKWTLAAVGEIRGVQSGRCVDASGQGTADGTPVILYSCNGGANQRWSRPA